MNTIDLTKINEYLEIDSFVPSGLRWKKKTNNHIIPGQEAGTINAYGSYKLRFYGKEYNCKKLVFLLKNYKENTTLNN
jgi:hypothetical protein